MGKVSVCCDEERNIIGKCIGKMNEICIFRSHPVVFIVFADEITSVAYTTIGKKEEKIDILNKIPESIQISIFLLQRGKLLNKFTNDRQRCRKGPPQVVQMNKTMTFTIIFMNFEKDAGI